MTTSRRGLLAAAAAAALAACGRAAGGRAVDAQASRSLGSPSPATPAAPVAPTPSAPSASPSASRPARPAGPAREVDRGTGLRPEVALTFHGAGDAALGVRLLEEAEAAGAVVTVLAVGTWLQASPALARRVLQGGHELGNHTMTHPVLHRLGPGAVAAEVTRCRDLLQRLTGSPGSHFRPSGGAGSTPLIRAQAARAGYPLVLGFDVDPRDYADPGADAVVRRTLSAVRAGSIVSLHLGHAGTVAALPRLLAGLRARGLTPVTATRLLSS